MKQHLLFVCTANRQRSPTAEALFRNHPACEARSCGALAIGGTPCSEALIRWADVIFCMEEIHREVLLSQSPTTRQKRVVVLDIPDAYDRDDPHLVMLLRLKLKEWLG